jgi:hypothetical protein
LPSFKAIATPEALVKAWARCATTARSSGEAPRILLLAVLFVVSACVAMFRRPSTQFGVAQIRQWSLRLNRRDGWTALCISSNKWKQLVCGNLRRDKVVHSKNHLVQKSTGPGEKSDDWRLLPDAFRGLAFGEGNARGDNSLSFMAKPVLFYQHR